MRISIWSGENMEIERKFLIKNMPDNMERYKFHDIEQAYLCTTPVVRIRKQDKEYYMTYKSKGMMVREEYNLPLGEEGYLHLLKKADGNILTKRRYLIPLEDGHTAELDVFHGIKEGFIMVEVEFASEKEAEEFVVPEWFAKEVTYDSNYHNSNMIN